VREQLLKEAESILEEWLRARGEEPTREAVEGFRLLALHRQGAKGVPSFNACRETCREIAYHFNLLGLHGDEKDLEKTRVMMGLLVNHLKCFVRGKLEVEGLGEFCCSSRPLRLESSAASTGETHHG
jgi:hypothetical protein